MTARYVRLTEDDEVDIVRMLSQGESYRQIALYIGCNAMTVIRHAEKLGVESRWQKVPKGGNLDAFLAAKRRMLLAETRRAA